MPGPQNTFKNKWFFNIFQNCPPCALSSLKLPQVGLKLPQVGLKMALDGHMLPQEGSMLPQVGPTWPQVALTWLQLGLKLASSWFHVGPGRLLEALLKGLGRVQGGSLEVLGAKKPSWRPQRCQNVFQVTPKSTKNQ